MANEKVISTQALIDKFKEALADKWGYIWGTAGTMWTSAKQKNLEKTTDADRENSRKYGNTSKGAFMILPPMTCRKQGGKS